MKILVPKLPFGLEPLEFSSILPRLCLTKFAARSDENGVTTADRVRSSYDYCCDLFIFRSFRVPLWRRFYDVPLLRLPASSEDIFKSESANG